MPGFLRNVFGWWALVLVAIAIGVGQLLGGFSKWLHRALWVAAAVFAVAGAVNEWSGGRK